MFTIEDHMMRYGEELVDVAVAVAVHVKLVSVNWIGCVRELGEQVPGNAAQTFRECDRRLISAESIIRRSHTGRHRR